MDFDIYDYFNSSDVAEHCKKLKHSFSPIEKAVMISLSHRPLVERLDGYRALIPEATEIEPKETSDRRFEDYIPQDFGDFLRTVIRNEEAMSKAFTETEPNTIFQYTSFDNNDSYSSDGEIQSTYEAALLELQELYSNSKEDPVRCSIKKRPIGGSEKRYWVQDIRIDGTVLSTAYSRVDFEYDPNECTIQEIYIDVPSPFIKGDLVWYDGDYDSISIYIHDDAEWMRSRYGDRLVVRDTSDMNAHGILGDNEWIEYNHIWQHTDLSYFKENLPEKKLALGLIHDYYAGEIRLDRLIENIILLRSANALKKLPIHIYDKRVIDVYTT